MDLDESALKTGGVGPTMCGKAHVFFSGRAFCFESSTPAFCKTLHFTVRIEIVIGV